MFKLSFGWLRQRIVLKCVPHVQHDYFSSFNQSDHCFLVSSLPLPPSLLKLPILRQTLFFKWTYPIQKGKGNTYEIFETTFSMGLPRVVTQLFYKYSWWQSKAENSCWKDDWCNDEITRLLPTRPPGFNSCYYSWACRQSFLCLQLRPDEAYGSILWKMTH